MILQWTGDQADCYQATTNSMPPTSRGVFFVHLLRRYSHAAGQLNKIPGSKPRRRVQKQKSHLLLPKDAPSSQPLRTSIPSEPIIKPTGRPEPPRSSLLHQLLIRIPFRLRRWLVRALLIAPPLALVFLHFPLEIMRVNGPSMSPFLNPNNTQHLPQTQDRVLVQKVIFPDRDTIGLNTPSTNFHRGQIVVFYTPHDPEKIAVKRVVGVAGDRVKPLPGYSGGEDSVVIPYNHLWVEGDVNDREKSIDSNWYGPISQNLVIGVVRMVFNPWYSPSIVKWQEHKYPAQQKSRIEENVVSDAKIDPDTKAAHEAFMNGAAMGEIANLKRNKVAMPNLLKDENNRIKATRVYVQAQEELSKQDPWSMELAAELVSELEAAFLRAGLTKTGQRKPLPPPIKETQPGIETTTKEEGPARKALADYLEKQKKMREVEEAEMDRLDQQRRGLAHLKSTSSEDISHS